MHSCLRSEVMIMDVCIAEMTSYTYAVKGERLLRSRGYKCKVTRKEKNTAGGCGYQLNIYGHCRETAALLERYAIPYRTLSDGGA
ncbi:MAG: DUF3343 domain-containing protein [Ruminococcus flavefaciens]